MAFISLHGKPADIKDGTYERYGDVYNTNSLALAWEPSSEMIDSHTCACAAYNTSHSYYLRAAFISPKASDRAVTIRGRRLFEEIR